MKKSTPNPDATTQLLVGGADDPEDVVLGDGDVDLSPASVRMTAPPPLPPQAIASHPPSVFTSFPPEPAPAKPRYWIYALILVAFFGVSVAGAALLLRATRPKSVPAAKASAAPSAQPAVITIQPVDMTGPESTP